MAECFECGAKFKDGGFPQGHRAGCSRGGKNQVVAVEKKNKFNARKVDFDGYTFDSQKEWARYMQLKEEQNAGDIRALKVHPVYEIYPGFTDRNGKKRRPVNYEADFEYILDGQTVTEDVKGGKATQTALFKVKSKMFMCEYPHIDFRIT